jgi:hypothetical protein
MEQIMATALKAHNLVVMVHFRHHQLVELAA